MKIGVLATTLAVLMITGLSFSAAAGPAGDADSDGTYDVLDICSQDASAPSPNGCDTDTDGYGNQCDPDFNNDGLVGGPDFGTLAGAWGQSGAPGFTVADLNCDGVVGGPDFGIFSQKWNQQPGPSGLSCAGDANCQ